MSQQGPGGYGGWNPPGGSGAPPGPPGGPPGWAPQPHLPHGGYAPQPYGAPGGPPLPPKKTNPLVWVGVGCAVLFLIGVGTAVAVFIMARNAASKTIAAAGAFSSAVEVALDGGVFSVDGGFATDGGISTGLPPGALNTGGPQCEKAAECCKRVLEKTGANPATLAACEELKKAPQVSCEQALEVHRRSAPLLGTSCP
jgi:hypothetical protein